MGYGIPVRDITLLPIGGVARLERMPEKPVQELIVALAGPAVNVILAIILLPVVVALSAVQSVPLSLRLFTEPGLLGLLVFLLSANISLVIFNMIPAFPLDGGRVFRAVLGFFTSYEKATQTAANLGRVLAIGLGLVALLSGQFWLAIIALFIFFVGGQEAKAVAARSVLRTARAGQAMTDNTIALTPEAPVGQVAPMMFGFRRPDVVVMDPQTGNFLGVVTNGNIARALQRGQWFRRVSDIMEPAQNLPVVTLTTPLDEVQEQLGQASSQMAAVYDGLHFRGLIGVDDIVRVLQRLSPGNSSTRPNLGWEMAR
jgi:Zn-dependent protease/CBS domain-containing protein